MSITPAPEAPEHIVSDRLRTKLWAEMRDMSFIAAWIMAFERNMQALFAESGEDLEGLRTLACRQFLKQVDVVNLHARFQFGALHMWRSVKGPGEGLPQSPPLGWTRELLQNKTLHYFPLEIIREAVDYDAARGLLKAIDWKEPLRQASELLQEQGYGRDRTDHLAAIHATIELAVLSEAITAEGSSAPRTRM